MKTYTTYHSYYQVDEASKKIRRVFGLNDPTPRSGDDFAWHNYAEIRFTIDARMVIIWEWIESEGQKLAKTTITSPIVDTAELPDPPEEASERSGSSKCSTDDQPDVEIRSAGSPAGAPQD